MRGRTGAAVPTTSPRMVRFVSLLMLSVFLACQAGCSGKTGSSAATDSTSDNKTGGPNPAKLVMGLIPDESNQTMVKEFEQLRDYLEKKLGRKVEILTVTDYSAVIEAMRKKRVDLAWLGPLSYVLAEQEAQAEAIALSLDGQGHATYHSVFVVPGGSPAKTLDDLAGKSFSFVDPASTSGYLMPAYLIKQKYGKTPEQFFGKTSFAGGHDASEYAVKNRQVDGGADDDITYKRMVDKGMITAQSNRILFMSPPLPNSPIACRGDLDARLKTQIQQALLSAHIEIKHLGMDATRYVAASSKDYQPIRDMVKALGLQKEQMLK